MTTPERALRAVRSLVQFDLAQSGAQVAEAMALSARAQHEVTTATRRCEAAASGLRDAGARSPINPALLDAMHHLFRSEQRTLNDFRSRLAAAKEAEDRARTALAGLRNRERSLERALQVERQQRQLKQAALDISRADDMWLHHGWGEIS
jgi:DNA repair ATPase RecN